MADLPVIPCENTRPHGPHNVMVGRRTSRCPGQPDPARHEYMGPLRSAAASAAAASRSGRGTQPPPTPPSSTALPGRWFDGRADALSVLRDIADQLAAVPVFLAPGLAQHGRTLQRVHDELSGGIPCQVLVDGRPCQATKPGHALHWHNEPPTGPRDDERRHCDQCRGIPGPETDSAVCEGPGCDWTASGPWSAAAGAHHWLDTHHRWQLRRKVASTPLPGQPGFAVPSAPAACTAGVHIDGDCDCEAPAGDTGMGQHDG